MKFAKNVQRSNLTTQLFGHTNLATKVTDFDKIMTRHPVPAQMPSCSCSISYDPRPTTQLLMRTSTSSSGNNDKVLPRPRIDQTPESSKSKSNGREPSGLAGPVTYPQFLLLGDSITEFSTLSLQACLSTAYIRRLDVINRGLSGYTSVLGLSTLRRLLPLPLTPHHSHTLEIPVATIFFGANDAVLPGYPQHVPMQQYIAALTEMVHYPAFETPQQAANRPTQIILITPPPVNEHQLATAGPIQRKAGVTAQYARAVTRLGALQGSNVHTLDLWQLFMTRVGWTPSMGRECCSQHIEYALESISPTNLSSTAQQQHIPGCRHLPTAHLPDSQHSLDDLLDDGLHLNTKGYELLYEEMMRLIHEEIPQCAPLNIPVVVQDWKDVLL